MPMTVEWIRNVHERRQDVPLLSDLTMHVAEQTVSYHRGWPEYHKTPTRLLPQLASYAGVEAIAVKDESTRFGVQSFKILGSTWAIAQALAERWQLNPQDLHVDVLKDRAKTKPAMVLAATSDGNHGLGVAWTAKALGQQAVIYLPKGTHESRVRRIAEVGAQVYVTERNYDDTVRDVAQKAKTNGWLLVQDTAWPGYEDIPKWVIQGYLTMAHEAAEQWDGHGLQPPTHIILQAGVGSLAAAVTGYYANRYGRAQCPTIVIAEPLSAPALFNSAAHPNAQAAKVEGLMETVMAGLACGEPNPLAWPLLRSWTSFFVRCSDSVAARGTRILSNPLGTDPRIMAGESGSMPLGLAVTLLDQLPFQEARKALGLGPQSRILVFNTEGVPDFQGFLDIVWDGAYPSLPKS
ncbi:diaminopropionate ammonia-lyase [Sulfobacillus sp. hq2]|uniref:diaminopropionate ammonia-lyase n=1 Tax=Sulfobacillus TaxID=28033 RepID=UPI000CD1EAD3|nr:diaminopropionate ammonia-lyase [Sulfobacillus sp. hq2]POB11149.1 diaminopropionate ammonia-lyase [Sulfobacillus sp. hq2]